ncbi:MAG TPA: hypothetical protein VNC18_14275, partial [Gemmatimonadaceae bacterium]|nr:hypothetical protein [Gemmatimonadaceae bacterium]
AGTASRPVPTRATRGRDLTDHRGLRTMATIHPSAILRAPDEEARHAEYARFVDDLKVAARASGLLLTA